MSYDKTTWETGDIITAEKLNNLEDGVADASSGMMMLYTIDAETGDNAIGGMTFAQAYALAIAGVPVFLVDVSTVSANGNAKVFRLTEIHVGEDNEALLFGDDQYQCAIDASTPYDPDLHL